jgi:hypothetical protein
MEQLFVLSITELESRMQPGALSQSGFLGKNESLKDVLDADARTMQELGITYSELADFLEKLLTPAVASKMGKANVDNFAVETKLFTGFQICPWTKNIHTEQCMEAGGVKFGSIDWCIKNQNSGQKVCGPGIITHLIRAHHFFEGFESSHRVDPRIVAQVLEIGPYMPK